MKNLLLLLACSIGFISLILLNACSEEDAPELNCAETGPSLTATDISDATCSEGGEVTLVTTGGDAPFTFSLDGINFVSAATIVNIPAGSYVGTVRDANDCTASTSTFTIGAAVGAISATITQNELAGCSTTDGQITVNATGGTGTLEYSVDGGTPSSNNVFDMLSTGLHDVLVTDEVGCENAQTVHVSSGVSYASTITGQSESIMSIFAANCEGSDCHINGSGTLPDWSDFAEVKANAESIKTRTQNKTMPAVGSLTDEQIALIACWVDDGAKNN